MSAEQPTVAILGGTGKQGPGLALRWGRSGYSIIIGSRSAEKAEETVRYAEYAREWQAELAADSFERRMDWELFQASLNLDNGTPSWVDGEDDDEPQE